MSDYLQNNLPVPTVAVLYVLYYRHTWLQYVCGNACSVVVVDAFLGADGYSIIANGSVEIKFSPNRAFSRITVPLRDLRGKYYVGPLKNYFQPNTKLLVVRRSSNHSARRRIFYWEWYSIILTCSVYVNIVRV